MRKTSDHQICPFFDGCFLSRTLCRSWAHLVHYGVGRLLNNFAFSINFGEGKNKSELFQKLLPLAQSVKRVTPGDEIMGSILAVPDRSLLVGSVSV